MQEHILAILQKELAVNPYFSLPAQVADHIPVERRHIQPAGLGITAAQGDMDRAADLLIVEYIAGSFSYAVIHAKGKIAYAPRPLVNSEHTEQVVLA